jgi:hypothetical protein
MLNIILKYYYFLKKDCFYKKLDINFAILDYEQALELDQNDIHIKSRIAKLSYELAIKNFEDKDYRVF